jgi:hypothetical protein
MDGCGPDFSLETPCEPAFQDCPEGEKCTATTVADGYCCVDANTCVPIIGQKQLYESCTRIEDNDDCAPGLFCLPRGSSGDTGEGVCFAFCDSGDSGSCDDLLMQAAECVEYNDGILPLCEHQCDPLLQDCPGDALICYDAGGVGFKCRLPLQDAEGDGGPCVSDQGCQKGLTCGTSSSQENCNSTGCCTPRCECDPNEPQGVDAPECTGNELCVCVYQQNPPPMYEIIGLCALP